MSTKAAHSVAIVLLFLSTSLGAGFPGGPFDVTDLGDRDELVILALGDSGTGKAGQYRVGHGFHFWVVSLRNGDSKTVSTRPV